MPSSVQVSKNEIIRISLHVCANVSNLLMHRYFGVRLCCPDVFCCVVSFGVLAVEQDDCKV